MGPKSMALPAFEEIQEKSKMDGVRKLLELALLSQLVSLDALTLHKIIVFVRLNKILIAVSDEVCMFVLGSSSY